MATCSNARTEAKFASDGAAADPIRSNDDLCDGLIPGPVPGDRDPPQPPQPPVLRRLRSKTSPMPGHQARPELSMFMCFDRRHFHFFIEIGLKLQFGIDRVKSQIVHWFIAGLPTGS